MNNLVPAAGPSSQDVSEMKRLAAIMNGSNLPVQHEVRGQYTGGQAPYQQPLNETYTYTPGPGTEDVNAMKDLLTRLNTLNESEAPQATKAPVTRKLVESQDHVRDFGLPVNNVYVVAKLLKEDAQGKDASTYSIMIERGSSVVHGIFTEVAAKAVAKLMNSGYDANHEKVSEVVELDSAYNRNKVAAGLSKSRYQQSMKLGETAAADVFKSRFETARANALDAQDQINAILESTR